eukprot:3041234-Pyramimonas_sp.AAC.5
MSALSLSCNASSGPAGRSPHAAGRNPERSTSGRSNACPSSAYRLRKSMKASWGRALNVAGVRVPPYPAAPQGRRE